MPAEWQEEKDAIFAGMDAYAVKALGFGPVDRRSADGPGSLRAGCPPSPARPPSSWASTTTRWSTRPRTLAAEVADGRLTVIAGAYHSPQLTHPDAWRAAVEAHLAWAAQERAPS